MKTSSFTGALSPAQREQNCEFLFLNGGPYWHLCTDGRSVEIICDSDEDYKYVMNAIAICAALFKVRILTFQVMSNHLHMILEGKEQECLNLFKELKRRIKRHCMKKERFISLERFEAKLLPIDNLKSLRYEIAYTNRNGYLVNYNHTPFSYPWGSGYLYFNPMSKSATSVHFGDLTRDEKLKLCRSRLVNLPDNYLIEDGMVMPESICAIEYGESMFRDAHQYFSIVSKNYEAYSVIAKNLGDDIFLSDDEMFAVVSLLSKKASGDSRAALLPINTKLEIAKKLRRDYNASEGQIQRMLRLDRSDIKELFGNIC